MGFFSLTSELEKPISRHLPFYPTKQSVAFLTHLPVLEEFCCKIDEPEKVA